MTKGKRVGNPYLVGRVETVGAAARMLRAMADLNTSGLMSRVTPRAGGTWSVKTDDRSQLNVDATTRR